MVIVFGALSPATSPAQSSSRAVPFVFIGTAAECGGPPGSDIVTAAWLGGMGLPDNGGLNSPNPSTANDPHMGLLLSKNGPTADCSSAGATITNPPRTITELNFDYRNGTHCGAGAPRFNVVSTAGFRYFLGCGHGLHTPATQDPTQWTHVEFSAAACVADPSCVSPAAAAAPPFVFGTTTIRSISIVYDEGTEVIGTEDPNGVGLVVMDNISINNQVIRSGSGIADGTQGGRGKNKDGDDRGNGGGDKQGGNNDD
jgi:hypothetical protein